MKTLPAVHMRSAPCPRSPSDPQPISVLCQAKHVGLLLAILFAWTMEQVLWVHAGDGKDACYESFFDTKNWSNIVSAGISAAVVAAVTLGKGNEYLIRVLVNCATSFSLTTIRSDCRCC